MILCFVSLIHCLRPLVIVPPLYGSNLFISYGKNANMHWYCPESLNKELFWVAHKFVVPPMYNCLLNYLTVFWNNETQTYDSWPNTTVTVGEIGTDETIRYVDSGVFDVHFFETFDTLLKHFYRSGWRTGVNLFPAPYDWRLAPTGLGEFWSKLKQTIENAYEKNGKQKVAMFGYSCGGFTTQQFLSKHVDAEWKAKYIDRVILLAPSFAGVGTSFEALWTKRFNLARFIGGRDMEMMIETMPVLMSHLPNVHIYSDTVFARSEHDHTFTAKDLPDLLLQHKKITGDGVKIMEKAIKVTQEIPQGPELPTFMMFNSGVQTPKGCHFKKGWSESPSTVFGKGDGTILGKGLDWACRHWSVENGPLICLDTYRDDVNFEHTPLAANPYVIEKLIHLLMDDEWTKKKGRQIIRSPYVVVENSTYRVEETIRPEKLLFMSEN